MTILKIIKTIIITASAIALMVGVFMLAGVDDTNRYIEVELRQAKHAVTRLP